MATFILRRLVASFFIVLAASFVVYVLMANAGDPLEFLREITNPTEREAIQRSVTEALNLEWSDHDIRVIDMWPLFVHTAMTRGLKTGTTDSLGIRLSPEDIAEDILAAVDPTWSRRLVRQVHYPVGIQAKVLALSARFSPAWLSRLVNKRLAHR